MCLGNKCQNDLNRVLPRYFQHFWGGKQCNKKNLYKDTELFIRQNFELPYLQTKFRQACHLAILSRECIIVSICIYMDLRIYSELWNHWHMLEKRLISVSKHQDNRWLLTWRCQEKLTMFWKGPKKILSRPCSGCWALPSRFPGSYLIL